MDSNTLRRSAVLTLVGAGIIAAGTAGWIGFGTEASDPAPGTAAKDRDIAGLVVPGMPLGSPGMDFGAGQDRYDVLAFNDQGATRVYASYPR